MKLRFPTKKPVRGKLIVETLHKTAKARTLVIEEIYTHQMGIEPLVVCVEIELCLEKSNIIIQTENIDVEKDYMEIELHISQYNVREIRTDSQLCEYGEEAEKRILTLLDFFMYSLCPDLKNPINEE